MATSSVVVDISGDNDSAGAVAAASSIPSEANDATFERSCDNPECSAPKLISLVPKRETPEFIAEPAIMSQPTLINGFTTVFQIDGVAAKMNEILEPDVNSAQPKNSNTAPKSVFRIVPNTHAHIVNYVVVDGAGETMRKIKANDPDTMRKLLDSQRLSAEQMLKKLIGKAFKNTPRQPPPPPPPPPVPLPIVNKFPMPKQKVLSSGISTTPPVKVRIPVAALRAARKAQQAMSAPVEDVLQAVPPGITVTALPLTENSQNGQSAEQPISSISILPTMGEEVTPSSRLRHSMRTPNVGSGKPSLGKRKARPDPEVETIKKLRPRSPKQKTPYAVGLKPSSSSPPPPKKLPTLPRLLPKPPTTSPLSVKPKPQLNRSAEESRTTQKDNPEMYDDWSSSDSSGSELNMTPKTQKPAAAASKLRPLPTLPTRKLLVAPPKPKDASPSSSVTKITEPQTSTPKTKPLMGPASKMNALRAIAAARIGQTPKAEMANKIPTGLSGKASVTRIGETLITSSKTDSVAMLKTKPCSVPISKIELSKASETLKPEQTKLLPTVSKEASDTTKASPQLQTRPSVALICRPTRSFLKGTAEKDPLAIDTQASTPTTTTKSYAGSKLKTEPTAVTRAQLTTPKPKEDDTKGTLSKAKISKSDAPAEPKTPSRTDGPSIRTRASAPKVDTPSTGKTPQYPLTSKVLRVVLPSLKGGAIKSGVMTLPITAPHPNLKISSVISGGSAVAATMGDTTPSPSSERSQNIEKLQKELAYLRRTVSRLNKKK